MLRGADILVRPMEQGSNYAAWSRTRIAGVAILRQLSHYPAVLKGGQMARPKVKKVTTVTLTVTLQKPVNFTVVASGADGGPYRTDGAGETENLELFHEVLAKLLDGYPHDKEFSFFVDEDTNRIKPRP